MRNLCALSLFLVVLLISIPAQAVTTLAASLSGANEKPTPGDVDGAGFALVIIDPDAGSVRFALFAKDILTPTAAHIHRGTSDVAGPVVVNFNPTFENGIASGIVTTTNIALLDEIIGNPGGFYVNIHNSAFPNGAIRGQLVAAASDATDAVFPIVGRVPGANATFYRTDVALLNRSGESTSVVLEFYPAGVGGNSGPSAIATVALDNDEQEVLIGDALQNLLGLGDGLGALRVISPRQVHALARIYNDQRTIGGGTLSQFVPSQSGTQNRTSGVLPMLANAQAATGAGYRTNIGWFNSGPNQVTVTWTARNTSGTILAAATQVIAPLASGQAGINEMFPGIGLPPMDSLYVRFSTTGGPLYVYASVVDNVNGDGIFIPAQ